MKKQIHMIGNTHFDPVWLWRWDEALASIRATFHAALERMKEDEDFVYSFSAPAVFKMIEEVEPALMEEIRARVAEGRWELGEGYWLQPDMESGSGEIYVRHGLYAQRYLKEKFGATSETVFNIDSFGHPATIPQILAGCGIKNYAFVRPDEKAFHLPLPYFIWRGTDGSELTAARSANSYSPNLEPLALKPMLENKERHEHSFIVYGVTDHGGAPTKADMATIRRYADEGVAYSRLDSFFDKLRETNLPTVEGHLFVNFIGPSVNHTEIKQNARMAEEKLLRAEAASVMAWYLCGKEYPHTRLARAWEDAMFNTFHDIVGGCCIPSAYFDARNLHGRAMMEADEMAHFAFQTIAAAIKMPGKNPDNAWNLVLFNTNGVDGKTVVEAEAQWAWEFDWYRDDLYLRAENGEEIPVQIIREESVIPGFRSRMVFTVDMPAYGYRTFALCKKGGRPLLPTANDRREVSLGGVTMRAEKNGGITLSYGKKKVYKGLFRPYLRADICDTWGFNKTTYEMEKKSFRLIESAVTEEGAQRVALRTVCLVEHSKIEQTFLLYADGMVECRYRVLFAEENYVVKLRLPANEISSAVTAAEPYGYTARSASFYEKPMGDFLSFGEMGVVTGDIFAYDFDGTAVGLSLLRATRYGDLRNEPLIPRNDYAYMGQGETKGSLRLFTDGRTPARLAREAAKLLRPVTVVDEACHDGALPAEELCLYSDGEDVHVNVLKLAEDADRPVFRAVDYSGAASRANITFFDRTRRYSFRPFEIKTVVGMEEADMLEQKKDEDL